MMLPLVLVVAVLPAAWGRRAQVKAGYDCSHGCWTGAPGANSSRRCGPSSFRWSVLDSLHYHPGLQADGIRGGVTWATHNGENVQNACDPAQTKFNTQAALIAHAQEEGVQVLLQLHPPRDPEEILYIFNHVPTRKAICAAACKAAAKGGFDGISVDFEGPWTHNVSFRSGFSAFTSHLNRVAAAYSPSLVVTVAVSHDMNWNKAEDIVAISRDASDGIVQMTYDYLFYAPTGPNSFARPNTPMYATNQTPNNCVNASVHTALQLGVEASQLTIGIAWYGREVPTVSALFGSRMNETKDTPARGSRAQTGYAYQQPLAAQRAAALGEGGVHWDPVSLTPWYVFQDKVRPWLWWQGFYDNERSLRYKYEMVNRLGLRGVLIWELNGCTVHTAPQMWDALEAAFGKRVSDAEHALNKG